MIAHLGGGGGNTFVIVLAALAAVAAGLQVRSREGSMSPAAWGLVLGGIIVGVTGVVASTGSNSRSKRPEVALTITPPTGIELPAGRPVEVSVDVKGAPVAASPSDRNGGHVHVFLDGTLKEMAYGTKARLVFTPGTHTVRFEYVDNRHISFKPPAVAEARYTAR